jgi:3-oxoacyl-[acyl-carrier protein] reductase
LSRVALVTGASRGIGAAVARALAEDGLDVAIPYFASREGAERTAEKCAALGRKTLLLQADVRSSSSLQQMKEALDRERWSPDIVVHCAGTAQYGLLSDMDDETWDDLMDVHLKAAYRLAKLFSPAMTWRRYGRIVHLSSIWGVIGSSGEAAYSAAKGGINAFTKALAKELASSGVTVNAVAPGAVETDMLAGFDAEDREAICREIPLGRLGRPEEIAQLVRFLVSDSAGYVTGQVIGINGGWHL